LDQAFFQYAGSQELPDQSPHLEIADARAHALHQQVMIDVVKRTLDTLPTTITSTAIPSTSRLLDHAIRWRVGHYRSWAGVIGEAS
jgi:hypothetical protein